MDLLVAHRDDPAGNNMARYLAGYMSRKEGIFSGEYFDLLIIPTPVISADWMEQQHDCYDSFVFLSKHAAESGVPALTCHSTGNFSEAKFGGNSREVAVPYPVLQKRYMQNLHANRDLFPGFEITIEATHHGPSALSKPCIFIEVGTTPDEWEDGELCATVAEVVLETMRGPLEPVSYAICFGGTHYPEKFTKELLHGDLGLGTVVPKHALDNLDQELFDHILHKNTGATDILLDWTGLGQHKQRVMDLVNGTDLKVTRL